MLEVHIDDVAISGFTEVRAFKSMNGLCGYFTLNFGGTSKLKDVTDQINLFDRVAIYADGNKIMTAFVEVMNVEYSQDDYGVLVSGREVTCDVVDCIVSAGFTQTGSTSLVDLIANLFAKEGLGNKANPIKIIDKSTQGRDAFTSADFLIADDGVSAYDLINKYALRKGAVLITDEDGNLVIANSGKTEVEYNLLNRPGDKNNILKANLTLDVSKLYRKYTYRSLPDFTNQLGSDRSPQELANISATSEIEDPSIRPGRNYLDIQDDAYTLEKLKMLVRWRSQTNITNARIYTATLPGHTFMTRQSKTQTSPLRLNDLVKVDDEMAGVKDEFIVNGLTYAMSLSGNTLEAEFVNKYAYSLLSQQAILNNAFYNPI